MQITSLHQCGLIKLQADKQDNDVSTTEMKSRDYGRRGSNNINTRLCRVAETGMEPDLICFRVRPQCTILHTCTDLGGEEDTKK